MYTYKCSGPWITNDDRSSFGRRARWTVAKKHHKEGAKVSICLVIVLGDCGDSDDFKDGLALQDNMPQATHALVLQYFCRISP